MRIARPARNVFSTRMPTQREQSIVVYSLAESFESLLSEFVSMDYT